MSDLETPDVLSGEEDSAFENGHCRHCAPDCLGGQTMATVTQVVQHRRHTDGVASWDHDDVVVTCPACLEAERIAAWCDDRAQAWLESHGSGNVRANVYDYVAEHIRGTL